MIPYWILGVIAFFLVLERYALYVQLRAKRYGEWAGKLMYNIHEYYDTEINLLGETPDFSMWQEVDISFWHFVYIQLSFKDFPLYYAHTKIAERGLFPED